MYQHCVEVLPLKLLKTKEAIIFHIVFEHVPTLNFEQARQLFAKTSSKIKAKFTCSCYMGKYPSMSET